MKNLLLIAILFATLVSCKKTPEEFVLTGTIKGFEGGKVYLQKYIGSELKSIDSVDYGKMGFTFKGKVARPEVYGIKIANYPRPCNIFVENAAITVEANLDNYYKPTVKGSASHDLYLTVMANADKFDAKVDSLDELAQRASQTGDTITENKLINEIAQADIAAKSYLLNYVLQNRNSEVAAFIGFRHLPFRLSFDEVDKMAKSFSDSLNGYVFAENIKEYAQKLGNVQVGKPAPEFAQNDSLGKPVHLSSFKGKYVLVDFWASWCSPCRAENPNVVKAFAQFSKKGFTVLGVSLDYKREKWQEAIAKDKLTWTHVSELNFWSNSAVKLYAVRSIPSNVLIDPQGIIIGRNLKGEDLLQKLSEVLK
jgi:peroxiredoxin